MDTFGAEKGPVLDPLLLGVLEGWVSMGCICVRMGLLLAKLDAASAGNKSVAIGRCLGDRLIDIGHSMAMFLADAVFAGCDFSVPLLGHTCDGHVEK